MKREEFDHIRADVHTAVLEAQQHDPTVTLEILFRLLDQIGGVATDHTAPDDHAVPVVIVRQWAAKVLEDVQLRATSKTPYGEPRDDTPPEDHR